MSEPDERLDAIRSRLAAATRGPWRWDAGFEAPTLSGRGGDPATYEYDTEVIEARHSGGCGCLAYCELEVHVADADARLIENAPADIAYLLAIIDAQRAELGRKEA